MAASKRTGKQGYRINYDLEFRMSAIPKAVWDKIYQELISEDGQYCVSRRRFWQVMRNETPAMFDFEVQVFCKHMGCTIHELMNPEIELLPIVLEKITEDEKARARELYGLTKS